MCLYLLPANNEELIFFSANQIPFVLNLKDPDKEDQTRLDLIRGEVSEGKVGEVVKTPGSFLVFEQVQRSCPFFSMALIRLRLPEGKEEHHYA